MNAAALLTVIAGSAAIRVVFGQWMEARNMTDQVGDMDPGMTGGCAGCPSVTLPVHIESLSDPI